LNRNGTALSVLAQLSFVDIASFFFFRGIKPFFEQFSSAKWVWKLKNMDGKSLSIDFKSFH